jgi:hypothetical protein
MSFGIWRLEDLTLTIVEVLSAGVHGPVSTGSTGDVDHVPAVAAAQMICLQGDVSQTAGQGISLWTISMIKLPNMREGAN